MTEEGPPPGGRSGFVALVGRPNVGKSTLLNRVLKYPLAAISPRPQTTRNRIAGIWSAPGVQAILLDTPGLHAPAKELNRAMVDAASAALHDADLVVWIIDPSREADPESDRGIRERVERAARPTILAINKVDTVPKAALLPLMSAWEEAIHPVAQVPLSARTGENVDRLLDEIAARLPEGPPLYPEDQIALVTERFIAAEAVREQVFLRTSQEVPYSTAVVIERFEEQPSREDPERRFIRVIARIVCERPSQKGILIGAGGAMLKAIGTRARQDLERAFDARIHLELHVSVDEDWTKDRRKVKTYGHFGV